MLKNILQNIGKEYVYTDSYGEIVLLKNWDDYHMILDITVTSTNVKIRYVNKKLDTNTLYCENIDKLINTSKQAIESHTLSISKYEKLKRRTK